MEKSNYIDGVFVSDLKEIQDIKGSVLHVMRNDDALFKSFGECYCSEVNPGSVKGWKKHSLQSQNIAVPVGILKFVLIDLRPDSPSLNNFLEIFLGRPDNYSRLHIPINIWYGFKCISADPALIVNCADLPHQPEEGAILPLENS
ncbi:dTDP-4-dehydrorhamnose 3,5-epimerase family protein, partial [Gammaproteobacteria bacterium]|nr:dTDP-4-dehydrorhamnose 3,5-epimerase family protein [Gammaproteobacteria bacterium]